MTQLLPYLFLIPLAVLSSCPRQPASTEITDSNSTTDTTVITMGEAEIAVNQADQDPEIDKADADVNLSELPDRENHTDQDTVVQLHTPRPIHPYVIIANPLPVTGKGTNMEISGARVSNGMLHITFSYGGGCREHEFELYSTGEVNNNTVEVVLTDFVTDDHCKKLITENRIFDIKSLKDPDSDHLMIKINDFRPVRWQY